MTTCLMGVFFWYSEAKPVEVIYLSLDVQSDIQLSVTVQHDNMYHVYIIIFLYERGFCKPFS